jgi:hypothetical protein
MSRMDNQSETAQSANTGFFHRWYDMDIYLSELVRTLESLSEESQTLFAFLLVFFSDEIVRRKGRAFFRELQWEKLMGIYKSKSGRRWYDQHAILHTAFNKLYSLNDLDKAAIARELHIPGRIVSHYEAYCSTHQTRPDLEMVYSILETSFKDGPEQAMSVYSVFD